MEENKPQVFINFRGKDERLKLVPHLIHHLKVNNVNVVIDNDATGKQVGKLLKYIRNSRIVIVIFSISYLESRCCLDELVEIMKCLETKKLEFAIPIFYKLKPSHVKDQTGDFGKRFVALQNKHPDCVKTWKEALEVVSRSIGLTYEKKSSLSELDFVMKIVEKVNKILTDIASKEGNNSNTSEMTKILLQGEASNPAMFDANDLYKLLHLSKTLEALDLERSCLQGFMFGPAWKDLISSMQRSNKSFKISPPEMPLHSLDTLGNESVEKATNWLALQMTTEQYQPALIFTNWGKIEQDAKNSIIYSAGKKKQMMSQILKDYNRDVDLKPSVVRVPTWDRKLEHKPPTDWHRRFRRCISFRDNRDRFYPLPYEMYSGQNPVVTQQTIDSITIRKCGILNQEEDMSFISLLRYFLLKLCLSLT